MAKFSIETRGEGGYVIVAPSRNGDRAWELWRGGIDTICYCTMEEWAQIEAVLASFDVSAPAPPTLTVPTRSTVRFDPHSRRPPMGRPGRRRVG